MKDSLLKKHQAFSQNLLFWCSDIDTVNPAFCERCYSIVNRLFMTLESIYKISYLLSQSDNGYLKMNRTYNNYSPVLYLAQELQNKPVCK